LVSEALAARMELKIAASDCARFEESLAKSIGVRRSSG